jgi:hypothetical protein
MKLPIVSELRTMASLWRELSLCSCLPRLNYHMWRSLASFLTVPGPCQNPRDYHTLLQKNLVPTQLLGGEAAASHNDLFYQFTLCLYGCTGYCCYSALCYCYTYYTYYYTCYRFYYLRPCQDPAHILRNVARPSPNFSPRLCLLKAPK